MRQWRILVCALTALAARQCLGDILPVNDFEGYQNGVYGTPPQQKFWTSNITAPGIQLWNLACGPHDQHS